jgi:hypothetical protein
VTRSGERGVLGEGRSPGGSPAAAGSGGEGAGRRRWLGDRGKRRERSVLRELLVGDGELDQAREGKHGCLRGSWLRCESVCRVGAPFKGRREGERAVYRSGVNSGATAGGGWG